MTAILLIRKERLWKPRLALNPALHSWIASTGPFPPTLEPSPVHNPNSGQGLRTLVPALGPTCSVTLVKSSASLR